MCCPKGIEQMTLDRNVMLQTIDFFLHCLARVVCLVDSSTSKGDHIVDIYYVIITKRKRETK